MAGGEAGSAPGQGRRLECEQVFWLMEEDRQEARQNLFNSVKKDRLGDVSTGYISAAG
jgi:hypothetical protein